MAKSTRARQLHRWLAATFTLTVLANFIAMPFGTVPPWILYAPLPPLFLLMGTGLTMLVSYLLANRQSRPIA